MTWMLLAVGGALGAVVRDLSTSRRGQVSGVDTANRVGSVLLGVVVAAVVAGRLGDLHLAALGTGVAGGLTTFSTWMVHLLEPPDDPAGEAGPDWWRLVRETALGLGLAATAMLATGAVLT